MAINPYGLNKRVYFGHAKTDTNPNTGGPIEKFDQQFKRWCSIATQTINQQFSVINTKFEDSITIIIRHTPKVEGLELAKMGGQVYDIINYSPDESVNVQRFDYVTLKLNEKVMG